jgi:mitochondrial inner membrane protease ATP23
MVSDDKATLEQNTRCNTLRQFALTKDPAVRFMLSQLDRAGCTLAEDSIQCRQCDGAMAGGFQDDGGIVLCSNHIATQEHASTTLVHEAIHAFDQCRAKVDWGNCVHHACSEIRAAALSGDCSFGREVFLRRNFGWAKQFQRCVQRRAEISVGMNPSCDALETKRAVRTAWDACYNDTSPFERLP